MPVDLRISELQLPTYFIYLSVLYSLLLIFTNWRSKVRRTTATITLNLCMILMVFGFIGARLFHIVFEAPMYYANNPAEIFKFWQGGFVFFGGVIVGGLASLIYLRRFHLNFNDWADFFAPTIALGYGLGRGACFLTGCCYGKFCTLPWSINGRHPTQVYAVVLELLLFGVLLIIEAKKWFKKPGALFYFWMFAHGINRLIMENFRDDFRGPVWFDLTISSWIAFVMIAVSLFAFYRSSRNEVGQR